MTNILENDTQILRTDISILIVGEWEYFETEILVLAMLKDQLYFF